MDHDFWLKFYSNWTIDDLVKELGTCHLYQQDLLARSCQGLVTMEMGLRMMISSQMRETTIVQALREIIKNGNEKTE